MPSENQKPRPWPGQRGLSPNKETLQAAKEKARAKAVPEKGNVLVIMRGKGNQERS
ncbi:hypothetical protein C0J52_12751 [Blattella germanica]|nr:hypothetical protein C0J52_12751 [Blattella germanica]